MYSANQEKLINEFTKLNEVNDNKIKTSRDLIDIDSSLFHRLRKEFKSWGNFRDIIDENSPTKKGTYDQLSKEDCIKIIKENYHKYGSNSLLTTFIINDLKQTGFVSHVQKIFGSWTEGKNAAGFKSKRVRWSKKELKEEYKNISKNQELEDISSAWLVNNGYGHLIPPISRYYGSFEKFREELGLKKVRITEKWTKESIIKKIKELAELHGKEIINQSKLSKIGYSGLSTAIPTIFLSWDDLRESAGYSPLKKRTNWEEINLENYFKNLINEFGEEKALSSDWLSRNHEGTFLNQVNKRYGGWSKFKELLGYEATVFPYLNERIKNHKRIKSILNALRNHIKALEPRDIYILFQQHNLTDLPRNQGGLLIQRLLGGELPFEAIEDWLDNENEYPEDTDSLVNDINNEDSEIEDNTDEDVFDEETDDLDEETDDQNDAQKDDQSQKFLLISQENSSENETQALPDISSNDALNILNSNVWATDDNEAAESLICSALDKVWNHAYKDQEEATNQIEKFEGNKWCKTLKERFFEIYNRAHKLSVPENYIFPHQPRLMQKVAAVEAMKRSRLLILSGMGLGKTLASTLAVQSANAKIVWVICPNNTVNGWEEQLNEQWDNIEIFKKEFNSKISKDKTKYFLLNFEIFSRLKDSDISSIISKSCPDAIIIDEVQFAKQRTIEYTSQRRRQISKCILFASELNPELMVLGMSGTPILNNLMEGRKLIELIFSEDRDDLKVENNFHNAMRIFQEFTRLGIRQRSNDIWPTELIKYPINVTNLLDQLKQIRSSSNRSMSDYEKLLIGPKIPYIVDICKNQPTLIITEFITGIVEPLREALEKAGLKIGIYTGSNKYPTFGGFKNSLEEFKKGGTNVLIGSGDCLGTGVDGLQDICNHMIYATLPWTEGDNAQIQARLARERQIHEVFVHLPQTFLYFSNKKGDQKRWSFCEYRWSIIESKKALASAAVDGLSQTSDSRLTHKKALAYLDGWIDRLENEEIVYRYGRPIKVPLEIKDENEEIILRRKFGDFSKTNRLWNNTLSHKTHTRLVADPQEWEFYHSELFEKRKTWQIDPLKEVIKFCKDRKGNIFADFGCGTGELANAISKESEVYSFDHIAINSQIRECDIGAGVDLDDDSIDFAIFSLSLMGTNWKDYLKEAKRCLKPTGQIIIWIPLEQAINDEISNVLEDIGFQKIVDEQRWKWRHLWFINIPKETKN